MKSMLRIAAFVPVLPRAMQCSRRRLVDRVVINRKIVAVDDCCNSQVKTERSIDV
jgi:hypothetical protein